MQNVAEKEPSGLTRRVLTIVIFTTLILQPSLIYVYLLTGMGMPISQWVIVLLVAGLARALGNPLSLQETFILSLVGGISLGLGWFFLNPIKYIFFKVSPITSSFGIADNIPWWFTPPYETSLQILYTRTFFHSSLAIPLLLSISTMLMTMICDICLGYIAYYIYARVEELSFPAYSMAAETIISIAKNDNRLRYLWISIVAGAIYNILSFWLAFLVNNPYLQIIPRGLVDLTATIEGAFPGATFGFTTDLYPYLAGFLLPPAVSASMLIGSFGVYFIGNHLVTKFNMWPEEARWTPGINMSFLVLRGQLYFWFSLCIGLAIAAVVMPLITRPKMMVNLLKAFSLKSDSSSSKGLSLLHFFIIFLVVALLNVVLVHFLVPSFPWWLLPLFTIGWSLLSTFASTFSIGVTFGGFSIPYMKETTIYYSGYRGMDIWFAPIIISTGGPWIAGTLKQADMCSTRRSDFLKAYLLIVAIGLFLGFLLVSWFWASAPIPGSAYPYTITGWISENMAWARWFRWLWSGYLFHEEIMLIGFVMGVAIHSISAFLLHAPYVLISLLTGIFMPPPFIVGSVTLGIVGGAMTMGQIGALTGQVSVPTFVFAYGPIPTSIANLIGSLISKFILKKRFEPQWDQIAPLIVMGFGIGDATLWAVAWIVTMINKSLWLLPY
ncbi:MAG: hypothetical protein QW702_09150 [Candidatus Bathyarchaeia archaeon]